MASRKLRPVVIDFETEPIEERPHYPPKPVGVSIFLPSDKKPHYYAFGHPTGNNCSEQDAKRALAKAYEEAKRGDGILCHHAKFDLDVAETHWGLKLPPWELIHDTVFLIFLDDPYSPDLQLKPAAHRLLGMAPDEQDAILQWAIDNKLLARNAKKAGHLICKAPGDLVGKYADGDVIRTRKIFELLHKRVTVDSEMAEPYDRERRLMPILLQNERDGMHADRKLLGQHVKIYEKAMEDAVRWVGKTLKTPDLNLDAPKDVLAALKKAGKVDEDKLLLTPGGDHSASKDSLLGAVKDKRVLQVLQYQSKLSTALNTFIKPWHRQVEETGCTVHPSWNQVRLHNSGGADAGAKTGRLSASRFMNVPKEFEEEEGKFEHPRFSGILLPELPMVRHYLLPDPGQWWIKRDYSSQELRVLGHFEDGALLDAYIEDPELDVHQLAGDMLIEMGFFDGDRKKARKGCKTIGFGLLYGMGLGSLAERLGTDVKEAGVIKNAYLEIFPGLKDLQKELTQRGKAGLSLRTWGGRVYFVEPPRFMEKRGRVVSFEYKLLNFLIQGSSADCTKEAVIRYHDVKKDGRFLVMVHDEINISAPKSKYKQEAQILREAMASVEFDVPMLSDSKFGPNWGALKPIGEKLWLPERFRQAA